MIRAVLLAALASAALVGAHATLRADEQAAEPPRDPCTLQAQSEGGAITGTVERIGLNALAGAACELGVTRERLLLSLAGEEDLGVAAERRSQAFRSGLLRAIDEEERAGTLGAPQAFLLRRAVEALPIDAVLEQVFGGR